jgi:hypothetical protein
MEWVAIVIRQILAFCFSGYNMRKASQEGVKYS